MAVIVAVAGALGACATSNVGVARSSNLTGTRFMAASGPATPPAGFLDFCARSPQDCGLQAQAAQPQVQAAPAQSYQAYDPPAAGPRPSRGGYDWSAAFAAARPAQDNDQTAALRRQLYGRYMWQAAFGAARPQAPVFASMPAMAAAAETAPVAQATAAQPAVMQAAPVAPLDPGRPYLIKASYGPMAQAATWTEARSEDVVAAPSFAYDQAPAATEAAYTAPAAAFAPAVQPLVVTRSLMAELVAVDRRVNRAIVQTDDVRLYGQDDYWATPIETAAYARGVVRGDCEDYALEKRRALIAAGVPAQALSIAVADTRFGPHAVLLVDTDQGELVLDSLSGRIMAWNRTGYRWIKRQAWGDPMSWVEIAQN